jgi:hypothetical protein
VWFYVHERLTASQAEAVTFVTGWLRDHCGLTNDFGHWKPPEASDSQARLTGLQPWEDAADPPLNHIHDLHIRYYYVALRQQKQDQVTVAASDVPSARYSRFAGSVHYEVADEHPLHPYIDECPYCGRTGAYAQADDLFAGVHEPLGLELLLYGTIRGESITRANGQPVGGLHTMQRAQPRHERRRVNITKINPARTDMNIVDLAVVLIAPAP